MKQGSTQFDIREIWNLLLRRKALIFFPTLILPMIAIIASFFMPPVYESTVSILIGTETQILPPSVEQELQGRSGFRRITEREKTASIYNQITSSKSLKRLISALDIPVNNEIRAMIAEAKENYPNISEKEMAENMLASHLKNSINVQLRDGVVIRIIVEAGDPTDAQKQCAKIAEIFIEESLAKELAGVEQNIVFSEEQLKFFREKLKTAEGNLRNFRQRLIISDVENDTSGSNIRQIISAVNALDVEMSMQESKQIDLRTKLIGEKVDVAGILLTAELRTDKNRLLDLISGLNELLSNLTWSDPRVLSLNENARGLITSLNRKIDNTVKSQFKDKSSFIRKDISNYLKGQLNIDYNGAKRAALDMSIVEIKSRLSRNPDSQITLERLQSEIDHYKTLYELFTSHTQFAVIDQSAKKVEAEAKYNIVKAATFPVSPESPNKKKLFAMGLILGIFLGGGTVLLFELLDTSFKNVDAVEATLNLKVLGTVPNINLPFSPTIKNGLFVYIGSSICFILACVIVYLKYFRI